MNKLENPDAVSILSSSGLDVKVVREISGTFQPYIEVLEQYRENIHAIKVTSVDQVKEMKLARDIRLELAKNRVAADKDRKKLKEFTNNYNKAVQSVYNALEGPSKDWESYLKEQEDFAKIQEEKAKAEITRKREEKIAPYKEFIPSYVIVGELSDSEFVSLFLSCKEGFNAHQEAEAKRLKEEEAERLQREAERKRLAELEAKEQERLAKEREEARLKEEAEAEEARLKAEAEAKALSLAMGPDKDKLLVLAEELDAIVFPEMSEEGTKKILENIKGLIGKTTTYIREQVESL